MMKKVAICGSFALLITACEPETYDCLMWGMCGHLLNGTKSEYISPMEHEIAILNTYETSLKSCKMASSSASNPLALTQCTNTAFKQYYAAKNFPRMAAVEKWNIALERNAIEYTQGKLTKQTYELNHRDIVADFEMVADEVFAQEQQALLLQQRQRDHYQEQQNLVNDALQQQRQHDQDMLREMRWGY